MVPEELIATIVLEKVNFSLTFDFIIIAYSYLLAQAGQIRLI